MSFYQLVCKKNVCRCRFLFVCKVHIIVNFFFIKLNSKVKLKYFISFKKFEHIGKKSKIVQDSLKSMQYKKYLL